MNKANLSIYINPFEYMSQFNELPSIADFFYKNKSNFKKKPHKKCLYTERVLYHKFMVDLCDHENHLYTTAPRSLQADKSLLVYGLMHDCSQSLSEASTVWWMFFDGFMQILKLYNNCLSKSRSWCIESIKVVTEHRYLINLIVE